MQYYEKRPDNQNGGTAIGIDNSRILWHAERLSAVTLLPAHESSLTSLSCQSPTERIFAYIWLRHIYFGSANPKQVLVCSRLIHIFDFVLHTLAYFVIFAQKVRDKLFHILYF